MSSKKTLLIRTKKKKTQKQKRKKLPRKILSKKKTKTHVKLDFKNLILIP